eukprot:CAMPEP_0169208994 /NCGR_PEP_ID=MMETSP1016-20121227/14432_1 /TAXON_ID=342587 /ORGANISM="Karlodinium micrum, Strain CCMP2283" /LENGTH=274 /DNA_ID=CAMNT_0009286413 /DNA_START=89 /DNA_END=910 /DNA_ORIENTATION=+
MYGRYAHEAFTAFKGSSNSRRTLSGFKVEDVGTIALVILLLVISVSSIAFHCCSAKPVEKLEEEGICYSMSSCPSGVLLFRHVECQSSSTDAVASVKRIEAKIWLYEDSTAVLQVADAVDGSDSVFVDGKASGSGTAEFDYQGRKCECELQGALVWQAMLARNVPKLGFITMRQDSIKAVFDVSAVADFGGFITFFACGEAVAKIWKRTSGDVADDIAYLRMKVRTTFSSSDGTVALNILSVIGSRSHGEPYKQTGSFAPCRWYGDVGKRTLVL